jgi:hypothetical protein
MLLAAYYREGTALLDRSNWRHVTWPQAVLTAEGLSPDLPGNPEVGVYLCLCESSTEAHAHPGGLLRGRAEPLPPLPRVRRGRARGVELSLGPSRLGYESFPRIEKHRSSAVQLDSSNGLRSADQQIWNRIAYIRYPHILTQGYPCNRSAGSFVQGSRVSRADRLNEFG